MAEKKLEALIVKIVKKLIKKEIKYLHQDNFQIVPTQRNHQLESFIETLDSEEDTDSTTEVIDDIYTTGIVNLLTKEDIEIERKLRELKFKQELRKDWILFILRDVVIHASTMLFIFVVAGYYLFTLIHG